MSEKENEREMVDHWSHEHPLTLVETRRGDECYGCEVLFSSGEQGYGCRGIEGCQYSNLLHEECVSMAVVIQHPLHPQLMLIQQHRDPFEWRCKFCGQLIFGIGYGCMSSGCQFSLHLRCARGSGAVVDVAASDDEQRRAMIRHPSHPQHELKLLRSWCSFHCDACGTTRKGSSYTCTPIIASYNRKGRPPSEYIRFSYRCDVCSKLLMPENWVYHCQLCRYIVHIKCAFSKPHRTTVNEESASNRKDIIHLPTNEVAEELITPFVMRQEGGRGRTLLPPIIKAHDDDEAMNVNVKYKFLHHHHQLSLVSSSSDDNQRPEEEEIEEEEEDEENYGKRWELICDGCITPISSSSISSNSKYYYFMSCSECKYNLHMACFHLPPQVSSLPIHKDGHHLLLQSSDILKPWESHYCDVCEYYTNGLYYACSDCKFKADVKCACMPDTIHHAAHPQHLLKHATRSDLSKDAYSRSLLCASNFTAAYLHDCYRCTISSCDFVVHTQYVLLPASVTISRWDERHPLPLTYNATQNHPGDFYCDQCETGMNPKEWMYHCRHCDVSFHPRCFETTSGRYRNIKLGQQYLNEEAHSHALTLQLLTKKRRCDICQRDWYGFLGYYCAWCNFFICLDPCGERMINMKDIISVSVSSDHSVSQEINQESITRMQRFKKLIKSGIAYHSIAFVFLVVIFSFLYTYFLTYNIE